MDRGDYYPVEPEEKGSYCEYWINPNFQTCLKLKESATKTNVFLIEGRFYERGATSVVRNDTHGVPLVMHGTPLTGLVCRDSLCFNWFVILPADTRCDPHVMHALWTAPRAGCILQISSGPFRPLFPYISNILKQGSSDRLAQAEFLIPLPRSWSSCDQDLLARNVLELSIMSVVEGADV